MSAPRPTTHQDLINPTCLVIVVTDAEGRASAVLVPSRSHPGAYRTVRVSAEGRVTCDCPAGREGSRCRHRRLAVEVRLAAARALVHRRLAEKVAALGVRPASAADLYRED